MVKLQQVGRKKRSSDLGKLLQPSNTLSVNVDEPQAIKPSVRFAELPPEIHDDDATDASSDAKSLSLETLDDSSDDETPDSPRHTRSQGYRSPPNVASTDPNVQRALNKISTSQSYKVTGNTMATPIFSSTSEDASIHHIFTDDMLLTYSSLGGMSAGYNDNEDNIMDLFLFHTYIQSDPGEPKSWKDAVHGLEREWWIKFMTAEFNNFLCRPAWEFVNRSIVFDQNRKLIPTKLVFKKMDEIDGSIHFKTRDVMLGFMMIPGIDFTERFSPGRY